MHKTWVQSLGQEDTLEEGMATHSSILVWRIPWTEEPGRLQSIGSHGVGHNLAFPVQRVTMPTERVLADCSLHILILSLMQDFTHIGFASVLEEYGRRSQTLEFGEIFQRLLECWGSPARSQEIGFEFTM